MDMTPHFPIYLDYGATTPVDPRVADAMIPWLREHFGNPASRSHAWGWDAEEAVEKARTQVADLIGADPREIVWTSGATESNNLAIKGAGHFYQGKGKHLITVKTEHKAVLDVMRELERAVLLRNVDTKWMDHIDAMDELRKGIYLRGYAQRDPVVEYRIEGFDMFDTMVESIREDTTKMLLTVELRRDGEEPKRKQVATATAASGAGDGTLQKKPVKAKQKPGRNDPCPCGSGKKYKKCCGQGE